MVAQQRAAPVAGDVNVNVGHGAPEGTAEGGGYPVGPGTVNRRTCRASTARARSCPERPDPTGAGSVQGTGRADTTLREPTLPSRRSRHAGVTIPQETTVPDETPAGRHLLDPARPLVRWGVNAWLLVGMVVLFGVLWHVAGLLHVVVYPLVLAFFPAAVILPGARWLERRGAPPALAAFTVTAALVAVVIGLGTLVTVQVRSEMSGLTDKLGQSLEQVRTTVPFLSDLDPAQLLPGGESSGDGGGDTAEGSGSSDQASGASGEGGSSEGGGSEGGGSEGGGSEGGGSEGGGSEGSGSPVNGDAAVRALRGTLTFLAELLLGIVAVFFYVKDGDAIARWLRDLFPNRHRDDAGVVGEQVWSAVSGYIRGQALVATVDGVLVAIGLLIVGVPLAITLGVLVLVGAFIPVVGSILAGAVAVAVALATKGLAAALITLAIVVGVQQLEGNVLAPIVLGRRLDLHPLAVLVAITAGAVLLGPFGAIVAVPLAASGVRAAGYVREQAS